MRVFVAMGGKTRFPLFFLSVSLPHDGVFLAEHHPLFSRFHGVFIAWPQKTQVGVAHTLHSKYRVHNNYYITYFACNEPVTKMQETK